MITKTTTTRKSTRRTTKTVYEPISNNIYFDGFSYRVRVTVNGTKHSCNFSNKKNATTFRNQLLAA